MMIVGSRFVGAASTACLGAFCAMGSLLLPAREAQAAVLRVPSDFATLQAAVDAAGSGDTILVAEGIYSAPVVFDRKTLVVRSERGPHRTRLTATMGSAAVTVLNQSMVDISGFTIAGTTGIDAFASRVNVHGNLFVGNTQAASFGAGISANSVSGSIHGNEFTGAVCDDQHLSAVITLVNTSLIDVFNNVFHDNDCRGINLTVPESALPVVFNNTFVRNRTGIYVDDRVSSALHVYRNNIVVDNDIGLEVVFGIGPLEAEWRNNLLFGNDENVVGVSDPAGSQGNLAVDPEFIDPDFNYFVPHRGSPVVDAGDTEGLPIPARDLEGASRVQDGNGDGQAQIDLGAFEVMSAWIFSDGFD